MIHAPLIDLYAKGDNPSLVWFKMKPDGDDLRPDHAAKRWNCCPDGWMSEEVQAVIDGALYDGDYYAPGAHQTWRFDDHGTQFALRHGLAPGQPFSTLIWPPEGHYDSHTGEWDAESRMEFNEALPWPPQWVEQSWMHFLGEQKKIRDTELAKQHVFLRMRQERVDKMVITYHVTQNYMEKVWNLELVTTITQDGNYTLPESLFAWAFKVSLADYMLAVDYKHLWDFAFEQFLRLAHEAGFNVPSPGSGYQIPRMHAHEWEKHKQNQASDWSLNTHQYPSYPDIDSYYTPIQSPVFTGMTMNVSVGKPVHVKLADSQGLYETQQAVNAMAEKLKAAAMASHPLTWKKFGHVNIGELTFISGLAPEPPTKETLEKSFEELKAKDSSIIGDPFWDPYPD